MEEVKINENFDLAPEVKPVKLKALKIISAILYSAVTVFLLATLIDLIVDPGSSFGLSLAVYLVVILFIIGGIANGVVLLISAIGLVISAVKLKKGCSKKTLAFFIVFTALPIVTEVVIYTVCMILNAVVNK